MARTAASRQLVRGNWLPKITSMVTTERWTNEVLTSILLRVGSSGGGLPDALQIFTDLQGVVICGRCMHNFWCDGRLQSSRVCNPRKL